MKTIYALIVGIVATCAVTAQTRISMPPVYSSKAGIPFSLSSERAVIDTLKGVSWTNDTAIGPALIPSVSGGYVCGNNNYGDKQKAQIFTNTLGNVKVEGAIIWFRAKKHDTTSAVSSSSKIQVSECSLNGGGTTNTGYITTAPGTVNAIENILFSDIDTGSTYLTGANTIIFAAPATTSTDFAISVDFSTLAIKDTVGMISSSQPVAGPPGDAMGSEKAWEQWNTGAWHTIRQVWGLDIDLFIWALVENEPLGVQETGYINGARLSQNKPNPVSITDNTTINYELENMTENVSILIFDVSGRVIKRYDEGNKSPGRYSIVVDVSELNSGIYYYTLTTGKGGIAKKMIVTK